MIFFENDFDFSHETHLNKVYDIIPDFDYFRTHDFHKLNANITHKHKTFGLFQTNICSLKANFDGMHQLLESLSLKFSVIVLSETWNSEKTKNNFSAENLSGYQQYVGSRGTTIKGGCGFYVSDDIKFIARKDLDISYCDDNDECKGKWIDIITKQKSTVIGVYYRHPTKTSTHKFIDSIRITLEKIKKEKKVFLICGDFNYNLLRFRQDDTINDFLKCMLEKSLQPCILEPTTYVNSKASLVDNIFINTTDKRIRSGNLLDIITDRMRNFIILENQFDKIKKGDHVLRDFVNVYNMFSYDLAQIDFMNDSSNCQTVDDAYNSFHNKVMAIVNKHVPYKTVSKKEIKLRKKPWITKGIQKSIGIKNTLYGKHVTTKNKFGITVTHITETC